MTAKEKKFLRAILELDQAKRNELLQAVKDAETYPNTYTERLNESLSKGLALGPLDTNVCPMCGK